MGAITPRMDSRSASTGRKKRRGGNLRPRFPGGVKAFLMGRIVVKYACRAHTMDITFVQPKGALLPDCLNKHVHRTFLRSPMSTFSRGCARNHTNMSPTMESRIQSAFTLISHSTNTHEERFGLSSLWYQVVVLRGLVRHLRRCRQ